MRTRSPTSASHGTTRTARRIGALIPALIISPATSAQVLGTAFTYQGQLTESGQLVSGLSDLQIHLCDLPSNPVTLACAPDFYSRRESA